jgi:actin-related protein
MMDACTPLCCCRWRRCRQVVSPFNADGLLSEWDVVTRLWDHALRERLHVKPEEVAVLFSEPTHSTPEVREKVAQLAFEHLK